MLFDDASAAAQALRQAARSYLTLARAVAALRSTLPPEPQALAELEPRVWQNVREELSRLEGLERLALQPLGQAVALAPRRF